ncbi:MAG: DNA topoisomerase, partial [Methylococcaceae bacterium]
VAVTWGFGHLRELAKPDSYIDSTRWNIESLPVLPNKWRWETSPKHLEHYNKIGQLLNGVSNVVIATDADDEGEVIGRQILEGHQFSGNAKRVWISALDQDNLIEAIKNPLSLSSTQSVYRAGLIRNKLDWLFGMNLSRAFSVLHGQTVKIGRVKAHIVNELSNKEDEIKSFIPVIEKMSVFDLSGNLFVANSDLVKTGLGSCTCIDVSQESMQIQPPVPYSLSTLLLDAASCGIGLANAMNSIQHLYENGAISYPRTSSHSLPGAKQGFASHHAIIALGNTPSELDQTGQIIYNLVFNNVVMNDIGPANIARTNVLMDYEGVVYKKSFLRVSDEDAGWLLCDPSKMADYQDMAPPYQKGQKYTGVFSSRTTSSECPVKFNEADLLRKMMETKIGTESTRVDTILSLSTENLVEVNQSGQFELTEKGKILSSSISKITHNEMESIVKDAVSMSRLEECDDRHLIKATKWLSRQIANLEGDSIIPDYDIPASLRHSPI